MFQGKHSVIISKGFKYKSCFTVCLTQEMTTSGFSVLCDFVRLSVLTP